MELKSILLGLNEIKAKGNLEIDINNIQNVSENEAKEICLQLLKDMKKMEMIIQKKL